jgi:hypothetical protein
MSTSTRNSNTAAESNVIDFFSGKSLSTLEHERFIRLSPEYDGLSMLYTNSKTKADKLYAMKILCWGLRANGEIVGLVPWLNKLTPCTELDDPVFGQFEGYYDPGSEDVFYSAPPHKVMELETASEYFVCPSDQPGNHIIQEIPDTIGTHAMLNADTKGSLILTEVLSWRLQSDGSTQAMLIEEKLVNVTPVLPGDPCLYPAEENSNFRYFFQHHIANQIKAEDPDAMEAISLLFE